MASYIQPEHHRSEIKKSEIPPQVVRQLLFLYLFNFYFQDTAWGKGISLGIITVVCFIYLRAYSSAPSSRWRPAKLPIWRVAKRELCINLVEFLLQRNASQTHCPHWCGLTDCDVLTIYLHNKSFFCRPSPSCLRLTAVGQSQMLDALWNIWVSGFWEQNCRNVETTVSQRADWYFVYTFS